MGTEMIVEDWPPAAAVGAKRSVLAEDLEIDGDVASLGSVEVLGKVTGSVIAPEVLISPVGRVAGKISARTLTVMGTVDGIVSAKSVSFAQSSRVRAEVTHETIAIESGAQFDGDLRRLP